MDNALADAMADAGVRSVPGRNRAGPLRRAVAVLLATTALGVVSAHAADATWVGGTGEWVDNANWNPAAVPDGTATFTNAGQATVANDNGIVIIGTILFTTAPNAQAYTFNIDNPWIVNGSTAGSGIVNNSTTPQTFNVTSGNSLVFQNLSSASGGTGTVTINNQNGGFIFFNNSSTAANAIIVNGSILEFNDTSTAGSANITNNIELDFFETSSAGSAVITNVGILTFNNTATANTATINNTGTVQFNNSSTAANSVIINANAASLSFSNSASAGSAAITNQAGGSLSFNDTSTAGNATLTNAGTVSFNTSATAANATITTSSGGGVFFVGTSSGGQANFVTTSGGVFDISGLTSAGTTAGSIAGAGNYFLGSNTLTVGGNDLSTTVSGVIADGGVSGGAGGTLTKLGAGTLTLSAANSYTGATTVNAGALIVDGSTASSALTTVNPGATLGGSGTVGNAAILGGTLAPGSTGGGVFGPLTVQGGLLFTAASTYMIQVSPANAGRTNVTGMAGLGGATVNAVFLPGSYVNKQYTIVSASGGVSGTFNPQVSSNVANLQSTLSYDANDAFLNIRLVFVPPGGPLSVNQQNVGNAIINFFNAGGNLPVAFAGLNAAGLTIASGELGTGVIQSSFKADDLFLNLLLDPSVAGRAGGFAPGYAASQFAADDAASAYAARQRTSPSERGAYAMAAKAPLLPPPPVSRWSVWGAAYGGSETIGGNAAVGSQDTRASAYGVLGGADYKVAPDTLLGFALAGGATGFSLANGLGSGSSDLFQAGAFARHNFGPAYVAAALGYGWHDVTTNRTVALAGAEQLQGRFRADSFSGRFEGGYRFATPMIGLTPYAAAEVLSFSLPAYAEQSLAGGSLFALNYAAHTATDSRTELGLRSDTSMAVDQAVLTLRARAAWAHDYQVDRAVTAIFQALPGASFVVNGAHPDPDSALVSAGAEMKWLNGFSLAATFEGEFSGSIRSYSGKGVARYSW
jgi:autotransporter-associated beta strand protein